MSEHRYKSFAEFWLFYVAEHSREATRWLHFIGATTATSLVFLSILAGKRYLFPLAFIPEYSAAWAGHFFVEKNRPATFTYPLRSFFGGYKMVASCLWAGCEEKFNRLGKRSNTFI
ncbi:MAG: Mpo1-like protein [Pyrinomonadaceae bacterium]